MQQNKKRTTLQWSKMKLLRFKYNSLKVGLASTDDLKPLPDLIS